MSDSVERLLQPPAYTTMMPVSCSSRFFFAFLLFLGGAAGATEHDERLLNGLRDRRLFHLAELYCKQQLQGSQIDASRRALLVGELIRTYAQQALHAPSDQRDAIWQRARQTASDFFNDHPQHPRAILIQMQDVLTVLARAEFDRQEAELTGAAERLESARGELREATRLLQSLEKQISELIPTRHRQAAENDELTAGELVSLQNHVRVQLARVYRNQALTYPEASQDRVASLLQSSQTLEQAATQVEPSDPLALEVRLDQVATWRLLGELERAKLLLQDIMAGVIPAPVLLRGRAEQLRLAIAAEDQQAMERLLAEPRTTEETSLAELDLARLEALLRITRQAAAAQDLARAEQLQKQALAHTQVLEQEHGPYWGHRGEMLLLRALPEGLSDSNLLVLAKAADHHYLRGQWDEARATYEAAARLALEQNQPERAFELRYKAALVEREHGTALAFIERLRNLATTAESNPQAAAVHLQAVGAAAEQVRSDAGQLPLYRAILEEHIATWPEAASADQARLWLAKLLQFQQERAAAARVAQAVSAESPLLVDAIQAAESAWRAHLNSALAQGESVTPGLTEAIAFFDGVVFESQRRWPENWTDAQRSAALAAARLRLVFSRGAEGNAEALLRTALVHSASAPDDWLHAARAALVVALVRQAGRGSDARAVLAELDAAPSAVWLNLLSELEEAESAPAGTDAASLRLEIVERLEQQRGTLSAAEQESLERAKAAALATAGRTAEAAELYRELIAAQPTALELHQAYAQMLTGSARAEDLQSALPIWRLIAQRTRPRTDAWFDAKYSVALVQVKLGDRASAAQLLRYLEATGDLDAAPDADKFRELLRQAEGPDGR